MDGIDRLSRSVTYFSPAAAQWRPWTFELSFCYFYSCDVWAAVDLSDCWAIGFHLLRGARSCWRLRRTHFSAWLNMTKCSVTLAAADHRQCRSTSEERRTLTANRGEPQHVSSSDVVLVQDSSMTTIMCPWPWTLCLQVGYIGKLWQCRWVTEYILVSWSHVGTISGHAVRKILYKSEDTGLWSKRRQTKTATVQNGDKPNRRHCHTVRRRKRVIRRGHLITFEVHLPGLYEGEQRHS